eukprot:UN21258
MVAQLDEQIGSTYNSRHSLLRSKNELIITNHLTLIIYSKDYKMFHHIVFLNARTVHKYASYKHR